MLMIPNTQMLVAEAAPAATVLPCWHKLDTTRRFGSNPALSARCSR
jgi:hypothetical protein